MSGFFSRLFAIIRYESIIHEFDPWFNYRATVKMVNLDFYDFLNWFDETAWFPLGRVVGGTVYPGLMITAGGVHSFLNSLGFTSNIQGFIFTKFLTIELIFSRIFFWGVFIYEKLFFIWKPGSCRNVSRAGFWKN